MAVKVGINGYGRIGRNVLRALYESERQHELQIVAINDLCDAQSNAHLTQYDTAHGKFSGKVSVEGDAMVVNGDRIKVTAKRDPAQVPWGAMGAEFVLECTGFFSTKADASKHLQGGAKKVLISAPGGKDVDATIVYGVNHGVLKSTHTVVSNASCTTNCLAPLAKVLNDGIGIHSGLMTTIHSYTNDQRLSDVYHEDIRRARSATMSMIPTKTGAAAAVGLVLPELKGRLDGFAIRVPTINVSLVDLTFTPKRATTPRGDQRAGTLGGQRPAQGDPCLYRGAAGVGRLQPRPGLLDLRCDHDQDHRRQSGQGLRLVRQRVGILEPHARHHTRLVAGGLRCAPTV